MIPANRKSKMEQVFSAGGEYITDSYVLVHGGFLEEKIEITEKETKDYLQVLPKDIEKCKQVKVTGFFYETREPKTLVDHIVYGERPIPYPAGSIEYVVLTDDEGNLYFIRLDLYNWIPKLFNIIYMTDEGRLFFYYQKEEGSVRILLGGMYIITNNEEIRKIFLNFVKRFNEICKRK